MRMRNLLIFTLATRSIFACTGLFTGSPCTATVGTSSRNYTTPALCIAAMPASLVSDGNSYVCSLYNDSQFTAGFTLSGLTTDATHVITITAAAGQSFQDNAGVRTNALAYNQANGVGFLTAVSYGDVVQITSVNYVTISRLQFKNTATPGRVISSTGTHSTVANNIVDCAGPGGLYGAFDGVVGVIYNNSIILRGSGASGQIGINIGYAASTVEGNTIVCPSDLTCTTSTGINGVGSYAYTVRSNAIFGFTTAIGSTGAYTATNNATNLSSMTGSSNQVSVTWSSATPFTGAATASLNLIAVAATSLAATGYLDASYPNDISGHSRANPPTIGAWELASSAGPSAIRHSVKGGEK